MSHLLTVLVFFAFPHFVYAQATKPAESRVYDIRLVGAKIGELTATKYIEDSVTTLLMQSDVDFWLLISVNVQHQNTTVYHNNKLLSSHSQSTTSKGNFSGSIVWEKEYYEVDINAYEYTNNKSILDDIAFNVSLLYFQEPVTVKNILADGYGKMCPVRKVRAGEYEVDVLGNKNIYYYEKGKLVRASMHSKVKNYEVILR